MDGQMDRHLARCYLPDAHVGSAEDLHDSPDSVHGEAQSGPQVVPDPGPHPHVGLEPHAPVYGAQDQQVAAVVARGQRQRSSAGRAEGEDVAG